MSVLGAKDANAGCATAFGELRAVWLVPSLSLLLRSFEKRRTRKLVELAACKTLAGKQDGSHGPLSNHEA